MLLQDLGEVLRGRGVFAQGSFALRGPEERVLIKQRIGLGFLQPAESLLRVVFRIIIVAESECGALSPDAGNIFVRESGKLFVSAGRAAMQIAREQGEFFLRGSVFGSRGIESWRSRVRLAAGRARGSFRMRGFLLFLFGLRGEISGTEQITGKDGDVQTEFVVGP
jgi:hypothetical protein